MFDSSTKFPEGVLEGSIFQLGNYDECLEVNVNQDWGSFKGQHCMVTVDMNVTHYLPAYEVWYNLVTLYGKKRKRRRRKKERKNIGLPSQFKLRTGRIVDPCHQIQLHINNETG